MTGTRRITILALALALALSSGVALVSARGNIGSMESCWIVYAKKLGDAERNRQTVDPEFPDAQQPASPAGGSDISDWHDKWIEAGDSLMNCILRKLGQHVLGSVRFAHLPAAGMPHRATFVVDNPEGHAVARAWLFAAPLDGGTWAIVPRVTVNGRVAWDVDEPPADGPLAREIPLLPGPNEVSLACDPAEPVAAVLVLEPLD